MKKNKKEKKQFKNLLKFNGNIFKGAQFSLTMLYFLILIAIVGIFNIVIFGVINSNNTEISNMPMTISISPKGENSKDEGIEFNDSGREDFKHRIILARNQRAGEQMTEAILILDFAILLAGGFGSFWLAKRALEPLEKAHKLQSEFVSNASHEIRTPLAAIQLETEMILKDKSASKDDLHEILESNLEEAKSLTAMTKMLLKLSKIDEKITLSNMNLNEIVKSRIEKFPDSKERIKFESNKEFIVYNNETAIDEIATILIDNALKYNYSKAPIRVKIFRSNRQAVLEVANDSPEIQKEELDKFFERFYRCDKVRSCNGHTEGHGLGLAIAKKLAEITDSSISVRNQKISQDGETKFETIFRVGIKFSK